MIARAFPLVVLVLGLAVCVSAQQAQVRAPSKPYFPTESAECAAFSNDYGKFLSYLYQQRRTCSSQLGLFRDWVDAGSCCHEYSGAGGCLVERQCWSQQNDWYCAAVEQIEVVEACYSKVQVYKDAKEIARELLSVDASESRQITKRVNWGSRAIGQVGIRNPLARKVFGSSIRHLGRIHDQTLKEYENSVAAIAGPARDDSQPVAGTDDYRYHAPTPVAGPPIGYPYRARCGVPLERATKRPNDAL